MKLMYTALLEESAASMVYNSFSPRVLSCTMCDNPIAHPCTDCFDEAEIALRRSGVFRCIACSDLDLVVKGES